MIKVKNCQMEKLSIYFNGMENNTTLQLQVKKMLP